MKKTTKHLLIAFLLVLGIKLAIIPLIQGPQIFPDEGCLIETANHFAETLEIKSCRELTGLPHASPPVVNTILLSPFYGLLSNSSAFYVFLIFQCLLISSLLFPIFKISQQFIKSQKKAILLSSILLFIPQILIYEKSILTETLFAATNIWIFYLYILSFEKKSIKLKISTFSLAIIAIFMRPFGFISIMALIGNEFFRVKNKLIKAALVPLATLPIILVFLLYPELFHDKLLLFFNLFEGNNLEILIESIIKQINSYTFGTEFAPLLISISLLSGIITPPNVIKKTKWFIIILCILSLGISALHINSYILNDKSIILVTRYINAPLILLIIIGVSGIAGNIKSHKNTLLTAIGAVLIFLFFKNFGTPEPIINQLSLEYLHLVYLDVLYNIDPISFITIILIPLYILLLILIYNNINKTLILTIILSKMIIVSTIGIITVHDFNEFMFRGNAIFEEFKDKKVKIINMQKLGDPISLIYYWSIQSMTDNEIKNGIVIPDPETKNLQFLSFDKKQEYTKEIFAEYDYLISEYPLNHKIYKAYNAKTVYEIPKE